MENEVYAGETGTDEEGRAYLLKQHDGYIEEPELLTSVSVIAFTQVAGIDGKSYQVEIVK